MSNTSIVPNPFEDNKTPIVAGASAFALAQRSASEMIAGLMAAQQKPRNQRDSMDRIITACTRPGLAEVAVYQYTRGGTDVSGPSIRLAEEIARNWGNMATGLVELARDEGQSEVMAYAWDLESGYRDERRFFLTHIREKRSGDRVLTSERDIYELIANQGQRRKRACILACIPGDVVAAAVEQCSKTMHARVEVNDELIQSIQENFKRFGVTRKMIENRIQRRIDSITPALVVNLGKILNSLRDGMSDVRDWFEVSDERGEGMTVDEIVGKSDKPKKEQSDKTTAEPPSADEIRRMLDRAKNADDVGDAMSLISSVAEGRREELRELAVNKLKEFS